MHNADSYDNKFWQRQNPTLIFQPCGKTQIRADKMHHGSIQCKLKYRF